MAVYRVKYELDFTDVKGNNRVIQILKKGYFGEVYDLIGTDDPCNIVWENNDDFYNPIIGSTCTLNLLVTDSTNYDEFYQFDEREYRIRVSDGTADVVGTSAQWETEDTNFDDANFNWGETGDINVYWEGWLITDQYQEHIVSKPYTLKLIAVDGLGILDSYDAPEGQIAKDASTQLPLTSTGSQNNYNSFFYYIHTILDNLELGFDIYIQNLIESNTAPATNSIFHDISVFEFSTYNNLIRKNAKELLTDILNVTNSRIFQSNGSWYIMSNSNAYDTRVVPSTTTTTLFGVPTILTNPLAYASSTTMTMSMTISSLGAAALTDVGWYIGTDDSSHLNNTKVSSSTITSTGTHTKVSPTLVNGDTYYCWAFATNLYGTDIGVRVTCVAGDVSCTNTTTTTTTTTQANNVWLLSNPNGTSQYVQYNASYAVGQTVTISTGGTTCYTIVQAEYNASAGSFGTISALCTTNNAFLMTDVFLGIPALAQYNASFSIGQTVTKSDTGSACYLITAEQIVASPGSLPTVTGACSTTTTTTTSATSTTTTTTTAAINAWVVERNSDGFVTYSQYDAAKAVGDEVTVSNDGSNCYTIGGSASLLDPSVYPTISGTCATTTTGSTTTTTTAPALTFFRRYVDCATGGNDATKYFGNNQDRFPDVVKDTTGECWFNPTVTSVTSNLWIDQVDTNGDRIYPQYSTCNNCQGNTTTTTSTTTTTTTTTAAVYYHRYVECADPTGEILNYSHTSNSFPQTIRVQINGVDTCFDSVGTGGAGQNGSITTVAVSDQFANCTACNAAATTTTTTTTTTTQTSCVGKSVYVSSISATDVCCNTQRVRTVYINSSQLSSATALYTDSTCTQVLATNFVTEDGSTYYYWDGSTLISASCPACP